MALFFCLNIIRTIGQYTRFGELNIKKVCLKYIRWIDKS